MSISIDQARTLDAVVRCGSFAAAARQLHKSNPAVVYALKTMEEEAGLQLLDRSGYRTALTPAGEKIWQECRRLLRVSGDLEQTCQDLQAGRLPALTVVYDGLLPFAAILDALEGSMAEVPGPFRLRILEDFGSGVPDRFQEEEARMMLTVAGTGDLPLLRRALPPCRALLVTGRGHPLAADNPPAGTAALEAHTMLQAGSGADDLPTAVLQPGRVMQLPGFHALRQALLRGCGFGWMPEALVRQAGDQLQILHWEGDHEVELQPVLWFRDEPLLKEMAGVMVRHLADGWQTT